MQGSKQRTFPVALCSSAKVPKKTTLYWRSRESIVRHSSRVLQMKSLAWPGFLTVAECACTCLNVAVGVWDDSYGQCLGSR